MIPAAVIAAKRDGQELSDTQIAQFIEGYVREEIPDYQMSAMAMAIYLQGMTERETAALTREMLASGACLQWPDDGAIRVDKHSTGGLGDKTSIILAPLLAEAGVQVPMLSGRGLGPTGGTLDKLESIPGFRTSLSMQEVVELTQRTGCVITGASAELVPADRRLYALRDVTATVPSIPLITASIMSKKLAESLNGLVLDVKWGSGAFMKSHDNATRLAQSLVRTGLRTGMPTTALLSDMNQPLGRMCGNAVEILECLDVLRGGGPPDVRELTVELSARLLTLVRLAPDLEAARQRLNGLLDGGSVFERYQRMVAAQGGDIRAELRVAPALTVEAARSGFVGPIQTEELGLAVIALGGGRRRLQDQIDHSVGLEVLVKTGDAIHAGDPVARIFSRNPEQVVEAVRSAIPVVEHPVARRVLFEHLSDSND